MNFTVFMTLLFFNSSLIIAAAIRRDEILHYAAGIVFILLATGVFMNGLQIHDGMSITEEQVGENTTEIDKNRVYKEFEEEHGLNYSTEGLALILLGLGFYFPLRGTVLLMSRGDN